MATKLELMAEADRRGILTGKNKALFDEAKRRGLVGGGEDNAETTQTAADMPTGLDRIKQAGKQTLDYITEPINPDLPAAEKFAQSFARAPAGIVASTAQMAYNAARQFTDPAVNAVTGRKSLGDAAIYLVKAPMAATGEIVEGFARFKGEPLGLYGADAMSKAWDDPAMAILSILPESYKAVGMARKVAKDMNSKGLPFTEANAKYTAAKIIKEAYSDSPEFAPIAEANKAASAKLPQAETLTQAQRTGSMKGGSFEQGAATLSPELGESLRLREAKAQETAKQGFVKTLGPEKPIQTQNTADIYGQDIISSIDKAKKPVKAEVERLKAEIPQNYTLDVQPLVNAAQQLVANRKLLALEERPFIDKIIGSIDEKIVGGKGSMASVITIQRDLNNAIGKAQGTSAAEMLMGLKGKLTESLDAFSNQVGKGQKADYKGKVFDIGELSAELSKNTQEKSKLRAESVTDIKAVRDGLKASGQDFGLDQVVGETPKAYQERLTKDYQKKIGGDIPTTQDLSTGKKIANIETRNGVISEILNNTNPALDAAAKYKAFNDFYRRSYAERFKTGTTKRVTSKGSEITGLATRADNIARQYDTLPGANDLIRAVGPEEAFAKMKPYYLDQIKSKYTTKTGMNVPGAVEWLDKNRTVLDRFGLTSEMRDSIKGEAPEYFRQALESKRPGIAGDPIATAAEVRKLIQGNIKTFRRLYQKDPKPLAEGIRFLNLLEAQGRNKSVSYAGNSTSIEKMISSGKILTGSGIFPKMVNALGEASAGILVGSQYGGTGAVVGGLTGAALKVAREHQGGIVLKIINEAILDPAGKGADLIEFAKNPTGKASKQIKQRIIIFAKENDEE